MIEMGGKGTFEKQRKQQKIIKESMEKILCV